MANVVPKTRRDRDIGAARRPHPAAEPAAQLGLDQELGLDPEHIGDRRDHRSHAPPAREKLLQASSLTGLRPPLE